jgi:transposase
MHKDWLSDARKIPDDVMNYLRRMAVHAVVYKDLRADVVADAYNMKPSTIRRWVRQYKEGGDDALDTKKAPGATPIIAPEIDVWLRDVIVNSTPRKFGYDTELWTLGILVMLLEKTFGIKVWHSTVANHLHELNLSCQVPEYRAYEFDPDEAEKFVSVKLPKIKRLAEKMGADILFEDEAGIGIMTRSGRTWGEVNNPPVVPASDKRGGYNVLSAISGKGDLYYEIEDQTIASEQFIAFLKKLQRDHPGPIILLVDLASFHKSKMVLDFVRAHRHQIRIYFLPKHAPHMNPDEQVWNDVKHRQLGRQPIMNKKDLRARIISTMGSIKRNVTRVLLFFGLEETKYFFETEAAA